MLKIYLQLIKLIRAIPGLRKAIWTLRKSYHAAMRALLVRRPVIDGNDVLYKAILNSTPYAAGKMGSLESAGLHQFIKRSRQTGTQKKAYSSYIMHSLFTNAGVFPQDEATYDRFCETYLAAVKECNALAAWDVAGEAHIFRKYCPETTLIKLRSLEPYFSQAPWSKALAGKRVLVISPFTSTIEKQFQKREKLWKKDDVLPAFELLTIKAPLSAGLVKPESKDWFEALDTLKAKMDNLNYDVVLIGAGAFSLPLAVHAKNKGKVGIHLGGSLQILFGVIGQRWREHKDFKPFINEHWCGPDASETPQTFKKIEGGCYW